MASILLKPKIKLFFTDFWPVFNIEDNYFLDVLSPEFDIELDEKNPDFLIYSVFGTSFYRYNCIRIFYTGENIRPDFTRCDYSFSFDFSDDPRSFRLPLYPFFGDPEKLLKQRNINDIMISKTEFCNFIYSNPGPAERVDFFHKLSKYKKVISAGRFLNNTGIPLKNKKDFLSKFKFTIAFENQSWPGYTTEKIFEPMLVGSLPIYWGNPLISKDFNPDSFLNYHDYGSVDELIDRIIEIDSNDDLWAKYLSQPYFHDNELSEYVDPALIRERFRMIFNTKKNPVAAEHPAASHNRIVKTAALASEDFKFNINKYRRKFSNFSIWRARIKLLKLIGR
ncbi:MAG: glycosyltransferase family 10 domain-containing protein [Candidatus Kapaibacterium sp.]